MDRLATVLLDDARVLKCRVPDGLSLHVKDLCILDCEGVSEIGQVERLDPLSALGDRRVDLPSVVRCATLQDHAKSDETALMNKMAHETCKGCVEELGLDMRLVRVRYSFDRQVLTVQFTAEHRVDFRELIRVLASKLNTRVEMRQLGVRDEAAIIGGLGPCGRQLCCCSWLQKFESINVKMAKVQRLTLTPGAINGMCGRLRCCLRYEYPLYRELGERVARDGATVECEEGRGMVVSSDVLRQTVKVRLEDNRIVECAADDVRKVWVERDRSQHGRRGSRPPNRGNRSPDKEN